MDYKTSGVDIAAGRDFVKKIQQDVESTHRQEVLGGLGGFGGFFRVPKGYQKPVLVAGTDGVGTKLDLAQEYKKHFNVGIDLVAMCVNDVITSGAEPLFFLDYIATSKLSSQALAEVVAGIAQGCRQTGCSLLGGETVEMPGFYSKGRYDLAGFSVAVVEENQLIDGSRICAGDEIIAVESSGLHSNGFSLVREVLSIVKADQNTRFGKNNFSVIDKLLTPTNLYSQLVKNLRAAKIPMNGMAHITGGGLPENLPRCLPRGFNAFIDIKTWTKPEIFQWLQDNGNIPEKDLWNTFNLGVGYCLIVPKSRVTDAIQVCSEQGFNAWVMGFVEESPSPIQPILRGLSI